MYLRLGRDSFEIGEYEVRTIRTEDMFTIRRWRNEQMEVLRQNRPLSEEDQRRYFEQIILPSFSDNNTQIMLFCFFHQDHLIGYGGLTNLDWVNLRGEISFLLETSRSDKNAQEQYRRDFSAFLQLMKLVAFDELTLHRLHTETYEFRSFHISVLEQNGFHLEGRMRDHIRMNGQFVDSLIHGCVKEPQDV